MGEPYEYEYDTLELMQGVLKDVYSDCDVPEADLVEFARELDTYLFEQDGDLFDILDMVYRFEQYMRSQGVTINVGRQCMVHLCIINTLDRNEFEAQRLYESFLGYHDVQSFSFLMEDYRDWLTQKQVDEILEIAKDCFIEEVWRDYV